MYYTFGISKAEGEQGAEVKDRSALKSILLIIGGLVGLTLGGKWIVDSAVAIAKSWNISEAVIGLTVVAVGTSLPELATSAVAAFRKQSDIAVGNVVGSNIFNIFWILGLSAFISPLPFSDLLMRDVAMVVFATFLLFEFMFIGKRHILERWQGVLFIVIYVLYVVIIVGQEVIR